MNTTRQQTQSKPVPALTPARSGFLQRKCACGQHTTSGAECAECTKKKLGLQRKLIIGASNDPLEQEADRVADQVMVTPSHPAVSGAPPRIQRFSGRSSGQMDAAPVSVDQALASPGRPLEPALRRDMEQRFGYDFSRVRVHSGAAAEQSAQDVNANAYTIGHDIVFGAGPFALGTHEGQRLIAHELTHVVQQTGGVGAGSTSEAHGRADTSAGAIGNQRLGVGLAVRSVEPGVLRRDSKRTITVIMHPEEEGSFTGSFKLPEGAGLFSYTVDLRNVPELLLDRANRPKLDLAVQSGIHAVLLEQLKSGPLPSDLPALHISLDAGYSKAVNEKGHVETLVRRGARAELKRMLAERGPADRPADVLEAIVHIMAGNQVVGDYGPQGEPLMHPKYYIEIKKNIVRKDYVDLLWEWFQLTNETVTDKRGVTITVQGSAARARIARAAAATEHIIAKVEKKAGAKWVARFNDKVEDFKQRAVREEVGGMIEAGVRKEREARPETGSMSEDEQVKSVAAKAAVTLAHWGELAHRALESKTASEVNEHIREVFHEQMRDYLHKTFIDKKIIGDPGLLSSELASKMSIPDAIAWLKGGLDAASAVLSLTDPAARKELFEARSSYFGKFEQGLEVTELVFKFVSGAVAFGGAGTYSLARVLGKADLAAQALEVSTKWIGNVTGALHVIGTIHGIMVVLDANASTDEKAAGLVEATSSALSLAGFAARWTPRLAGAARWGGPIGISLTLNFWQFGKLLSLQARARVGLARLDWVSCYKATQSAAAEAQDWMQRLAVATLLISQETDGARLSELRKNAEIFRKELIEGRIKPYLANRLHPGVHGDPDDCGPSLAERFKPLVPVFDRGVTTDDQALAAAATFLNTTFTALTEWDKIVAAGIK